MQDASFRVVDSMPLWLLALLFLAALVAARAFGTKLHHWRHRGSRPGEESGQEGYILSGVLGLLALLVAFTFSLALDRFEQRRDLVIAEANALDTFRLRTALLSDPAPIMAPLRDYAAYRLRFGQQVSDPSGDAQQARLQARLWAATLNQLGTDKKGPLAGTLLPPLNEAFDLATARKAERLARLPASVLSVLLVYSLAAATVVGYAVSSNRLRLVSYMLFALLTLSIALIVDLDQPVTGTIRIPQGSMQDLVTTLGGG